MTRNCGVFIRWATFTLLVAFASQFAPAQSPVLIPNQAATVLGFNGLSGSGNPASLTGSYQGAQNSLAISTISASSGTVTFTTASSASLTVGQYINVSGVSGTGATALNGNFAITSANNTTFTYTYSDGTVSATGTGGILTTNVFNSMQLNLPAGVALDPTGMYLYVLDKGNNIIREVTLANGSQTIFFPGSAPSTIGCTPGTSSTSNCGYNKAMGGDSGSATAATAKASFASATILPMAVDSWNNVYFADVTNRVRVIYGNATNANSVSNPLTGYLESLYYATTNASTTGTSGFTACPTSSVCGTSGYYSTSATTPTLTVTVGNQYDSTPVTGNTYTLAGYLTATNQATAYTGTTQDSLPVTLASTSGRYSSTTGYKLGDFPLLAQFTSIGGIFVDSNGIIYINDGATTPVAGIALRVINTTSTAKTFGSVTINPYEIGTIEGFLSSAASGCNYAAPGNTVSSSTATVAPIYLGCTSYTGIPTSLPTLTASGFGSQGTSTVNTNLYPPTGLYVDQCGNVFVGANSGSSTYPNRGVMVHYEVGYKQSSCPSTDPVGTVLVNEGYPSVTAGNTYQFLGAFVRGTTAHSWYAPSKNLTSTGQEYSYTPLSFTEDSVGNLYIVVGTDANLVRVDFNTGTATTLGQVALASGHTSSTTLPTAIPSCTTTNSILAGTATDLWGAGCSNGDVFFGNTAPAMASIAIDSYGNLYIAEAGTNTVREILAGNTFGSVANPINSNGTTVTQNLRVHFYPSLLPTSTTSPYTGDFTISGAAFSLGTWSCVKNSNDSSYDCVVSVTYTPSYGNSIGSLTAHTAGGGSTSYALTGYSTAPPLPPPSITVVPSTSATTYGTSITVTVTLSGSSSSESYPTGAITLTATPSGGSATTLLKAVTLSNGSVTYTGTLPTGTDTITANYGGDMYYGSGSGSANSPVVVSQAATSVTWTPSATSQTYGTAIGTGVLDATGSVAGSIAYSSNISAGSCGTTIVSTCVLNGGSYTLTATLTPTDSKDYASSTATTSYTVNPAAQVITYTGPTTATYGVGSITLSATGGASANPVTFSVISGPGTVSGTNNSTLTITGAGTIVIAADEAGNTNYAAATEVQQNIIVSPESQTITYTGPTAAIFGTGTQTLSATATSGLPVTFSVVSGPGIVSGANGSTLTITGVGTILIAANQAGNTNYAVATQVTQNIVVSQGTPVLGWTPGTSTLPFGTPIGSAVLDASASVPGNFSYTAQLGAGSPQSISAASVLAVGSYTLTATFTPTDAVDYISGGTTTASFTITKATPTVTLATSSSSITAGSAVKLTATVTGSAGGSVYPAIVAFFDGSTQLARIPVAGASPASGFTTGNAVFSVVPGLGVHSYTATVYAGVSSYLTASSTAASVTVTGTEPSLTTLSASPNAINTSNYDFTASVVGSGFPTPTGILSLLDQTNSNAQVGTVSLIGASGTTQLQQSSGGSTVSTASTPSLVVSADLNGDGKPDLVVASASGQPYLTIILIPQTGSPTTSTITLPGSAGAIAIGDFNQDGIPDIAVASSTTPDVYILLGKGNGTFNAPSTIVTGYASTGLAVADFNQDGILDLVVTSAAGGNLLLLEGNGDGTFQSPQTISAGLNPILVRAADINNSGTPSLVATDGSTGVSVLVNNANGTGTFQSPVLYSVASPAGMVLADVNGDGIPDIVLTTQGSSPSITVLPGKGDGTFLTAVTSTAPANLTNLTVADFNGDGYPDVIAATNASSTGLSFFAGKGTGSFVTAAPVSGSAGIRFADVATADMDGDGTPDVAAAAPAANLGYAFFSKTTVTATTQNVAVSGTGTHQVFASYPGDTHYSSSTSSTVSVTAHTVTTPTIVWSPSVTTQTYGTAIGTGVLDAYEKNSVPGSFAYTAQLGANAPITVTSASVLGAGVWTITVTFTPTNSVNYTTATSTLSYTVNKATPSLSWTPTAASLTYGTAAGTGTLNATALNGVAGSFTYTSKLGSGSAQTLTSSTVLSVGSYTLTALFTPTDTADYNTNTATAPLSITQAMLTLAIQPSTKIYGAALPTFTVVATGLKNGDTVGTTLSVSYTTTATASSPVSNYTVTGVASGSAAANYVITVTPGTLAVTAASLTVNVNNASAVYGALLPSFSASTTGLVNGDTVGTTISLSFSTTASQGSPVASYPINATVGGTAAGNYAPIVNAGSLTIGKAPLTILIGTASSAYGVTPNLSSLPVTYSGLVNNDTAATALSGAASYSTTATAASPVGSYPITGAIGSLTAVNYTISFTNGSYSVTKAALTVAMNSLSSVYGAALPSLTGTATGLANGDTLGTTLILTGSTTATAGAAAGSYPITGSVTGTATSNYTITVTPSTLTITPAPLTVTAFSATMVYGSALPNFTSSYSGFVNGDTASTAVTGAPKITTTATSTTGTGQYPITPGAGTMVAPNYSFVFVNGTLTITAAPATLVVNNATRPYGAANPTFTGTLTGILNNDPVTVVYSTTATTNSAIGSYSITGSLSGTAAGNYQLAVTPGTLTITKTTSTITLSASAGSLLGTQTSTLTATVIPPSAGIPTGTVTFYENGNLLGTGNLSAGVATITVTATGTISTLNLQNGTYNFYAVYSGDANFATSTSSSISIVSNISLGISITGNEPSLAISYGNTGSTVINLTTVNLNNNPVLTGPNGKPSFSVIFNCTNLPAALTCAFQPAVIGYPTNTVGESLSASTTLTVSASQLVAETHPLEGKSVGRIAASIWFLPVGAFVLFLIPCRNRQRRNALRQCLSLLLMLTAMATLSACGQTRMSFVPEGSYNINVVASDTNGDTATFPLVVTIQ